MHYKFVCPGVPATKGFRHHLYGDYDDFDLKENIKWCSENIGPEGLKWKSLFYDDHINEVHTLHGWKEFNAIFCFVFKNKDDAILFKTTFCGNK